MKRRDFLAASALAAVVPMFQEARAADKPSGEKQYLELRHYEFADAEKQRAFEDFLAKAAIPALNRQGIRPAGVFKDADDKEEPGLWVLVPHNSLESVITSNTKMLADPIFMQAGGDSLNCPKSNPAYKRLESSLLLAFDKFSKVEVPSNKDTRLFQLRIYESPNAIKAKRKIEMFNTGGEIDVFRSTGLNPVFFGESIIGSKMPNLTYMVGFDDADAQKKAWDTFRSHPKWKELSADPYYKDTVSNITNLVLRPSDSSQI
jgi:hypothetical protein